MFWYYKPIVLGLYLSTILHKTHPFVLLTANVEDLKRIAQKFVSDSLADKIARFIVDTADNNVDFESSNVTKNLSDYNDEFDVEKKDNRADYGGEFRQKLETKAHKRVKHISNKPKPKVEEDSKGVKKEVKKEVKKDTKKDTKTHKKKKQPKKIRAKEANEIAEPSSLEFYRSDKQLNKINPETFIELEKIQESDVSANADVKNSRKEFKNLDYFDKTEETQAKTNDIDTHVHKYIENDLENGSGAKVKKDDSENASNMNYSNRIDNKSEESPTVKTTLTTEVERNEFDQYFNTNYPKADVVATSGLFELTKSTKKDASDTDYE